MEDGIEDGRWNTMRWLREDRQRQRQRDWVGVSSEKDSRGTTRLVYASKALPAYDTRCHGIYREMPRGYCRCIVVGQTGVNTDAIG
uniref:Uncharacterized protein n=1 Tax=Vespula pensylvanica TaxID=30213 RepID=A0A834NZJ9_VESPE|nr:hypothetical protein H0235_009940 [Vespula pensylvanica]